MVSICFFFACNSCEDALLLFLLYFDAAIARVFDKKRPRSITTLLKRVQIKRKMVSDGDGDGDGE